MFTGLCFSLETDSLKLWNVNPRWVDSAVSIQEPDMALRTLHPMSRESFTSQIPHVGVFSNRGITLMTSCQNFYNQSGPFKYSKTQNSLCFRLACPRCL